MRLLGITNSQQKASFVQSSGGTELSTFWEKEARIRWVASTDPVRAAHLMLIKHHMQKLGDFF